MRIQDPLRGGRASRLAAGLVLTLALAVEPVQAAPAGSTEVVDRVNGFSLVLPPGWSASVPKEGAVDGATVLRKRSPGQPPASLQEGEIPGGDLKIQITAVDRGRYTAGRGMADRWQFGVGASEDTDGAPPPGQPLATRVAGLDAEVSTRTWPPGTRVLEVVMTAGGDRVLVADLMPIGSPDLVEALAILETIRGDAVTADPAPTAAAALERAARLRDLVAPPVPSAVQGGLEVTSPEADSTLVTGRSYAIEWQPWGSGLPVEIDLLDENGLVLDITREAIGDSGSFDWLIPRDQGLDGTYSVRVTVGAAFADSDDFTIDFNCGTVPRDGAEAPESTIELHMPFQIGTTWTVGAHGSFYGEDYHCNYHNDYYATDWNADDDEGEPVLAVAAGTVAALPPCNEGALGCSVEVEHDVEHDGRFSTVYGHLQARYVHEGQEVGVGHHLGDLGDTGNSSRAHLHLRFHDLGRSQCVDVPEGAQCPNDEEPGPAPKTAKPSPMLTWTGSAPEPAVLVDGGSYEAANGIRVTEPGGGEVYEAGEVVTIRWQSWVVDSVSVELTRQGQRWVLFPNVDNETGETEWTVPASLPCGTGYRIRIAAVEEPGVNDLSEEFSLDMPSCGLSIHPPTLPVGIVGQDYSQSLVLLGGSPPWRMQVGVGTALPDGLTLSDYGVLEGTPLAPGTSHFTIVAKDSANSIVEQEYSLSIAEAELCNGLDDNGDGHVDEGDVCQCDTEEYAGFTYSFCDAQVDWYDAARACSALGVELVKIESANENNWLAAEGAGFNRWIGLTDAATEEDWRWTDGSPLGSFAGWGPAEPNGGTVENCVELYFENTEWNDRSCGWSNGFACQETIVPSDFLCLTGRLIYNDPYGVLSGPVDHPVDQSIDSPGPGWTPIEPLVPDTDGRFCTPVLWERRYLLSELVGPPGPVRVCQTVIEPTDHDSAGTCGGNESGCEELDDVDFYCGS